jgi:hypothetical protein
MVAPDSWAVVYPESLKTVYCTKINFSFDLVNNYELDIDLEQDVVTQILRLVKLDELSRELRLSVLLQRPVHSIVVATTPAL